MKTSVYYALSMGAAAAFLAGCAGSPLGSAQGGVAQGNVPPIAVPEHRSPAASSYQVLHRFADHARVTRNHGGANPEAGLIDVNGTLYGTTNAGGDNNNGTFYSIGTTGVKKVLYRFRGSTYGDGSGPTDDLTNVNGTLYGTTVYGGKCNSGTVYSITTAGAENVLYSFCTSSYSEPTGGVVYVDGAFYGTAGATTNGAVYSVSTSGAFKVVYAFRGSGDGFGPSGRLLDLNGTMYGTTLYGGSDCPNNGGCGTVFSVTTSGQEKVIYSFKGPAQGSDGWLPEAGVIAANGVLYGTTFTGGEGKCFLGAGCGIVYSLTTSGTERVLYRFNDRSHGQNPRARLLDMNGTLYGTTEWGGGGTCEFASNRFTGCGTVYSLAASGAEQVLHSFVGGHDGVHPEADLIDVNGTLYGTTSAGGFKSGCGGSGCGTIFALAPQR